MIENRKELELMESKLPYLYDKFVALDENGIKIMVKHKLEQTPEFISETVIKTTMEYLLNQSVINLKNAKVPVIFVVLYEKNGVCIDLAHTGSRICFWTRWKMNLHFLHMNQKFSSENYKIRFRIVKMEFKGRDCIGYRIQF